MYLSDAVSGGGEGKLVEVPEVFLAREINFIVDLSFEEVPIFKEIVSRVTQVTVSVASRTILIEIPNEVVTVVSLAIAAQRNVGLTVFASDGTIVGALEPVNGFEAGHHVVREQLLLGVAVDHRAVFVVGVDEAPVAGRSTTGERVREV